MSQSWNTDQGSKDQHKQGQYKKETLSLHEPSKLRAVQCELSILIVVLHALYTERSALKSSHLGTGVNQNSNLCICMYLSDKVSKIQTSNNKGACTSHQLRVIVVDIEAKQPKKRSQDRTNAMDGLTLCIDSVQGNTGRAASWSVGFMPSKRMASAKREMGI